MRMPWICAVVVLASLLAPTTAINFYSPKYYGVPINFCPTVSRPAEFCDPIYAASLYCQRAGYDRATLFYGPVPAKATVAMQLMLDGRPRPPWNTTGGVMEKCEAKDGKACSAFEMIYCIRDKMFLTPKVNGKPLDWCFMKAGKADCGRAAANEFCFRNGFSHGAWAWKGPISTKPLIDTLGNNTDTVALQDNLLGKPGPAGGVPGKVCNSKQEDCQTFISINCEK